MVADRQETQTPPAVREPVASAYARFIILSHARTGSTMLASALHLSPEIACFREIFNPLRAGVGFHVEGYDNHSSADRELRDADFRRFLRERIFCEHPTPVRAAGFKIEYSHFQAFPGLLDELVNDPELRVIHVRRRNLLRVMISERIAVQSGVWVEDKRKTFRSKLRLSNTLRAALHPLRVGSRLWRFLRPREAPWKATRQALSLSPDECGAFFREIEETSSSFDRTFGDHPLLPVYYEDLVAQRGRVLDGVQSFLGLQTQRLAPTTRRQNPEPLSDLIANYDELWRAFQGTPYAAFFDERPSTASRAVA